MHLLAKHQSFNLVVLCIFLVVCNLVGCSTKTVDDKLYLEKMEHDNSDERVYQINEDFDYSQIVFRLYFTEDSNMWELVETYELNKSEINTFTVGYNYWNSNSRRFSDSQFYLIYGDTEYQRTAIELKNDEIIDGYEKYYGCGGYHLIKKELSYDESPFYMKRFEKKSYMNKEKYSIPHNWEDYKIENMKMTDDFNCEGYSCYVYTIQLIP